MIDYPALHSIYTSIDFNLLRVKDATVTLDEDWSPYVQVTLVCAIADTYKTIDPLTDQRITITLTRTELDGTVTSTRSFELGVRERIVDRGQAEMTIVAESDEALLQDWGLDASAPSIYTTGTIQAYVSARTLDAIPTRTIVTTGATALPVPYVWNPGTNVWDTVIGLVKSANLRLWSEGSKAFRLDASPVTVAGTIELSDVDNVKLVTDKLSRSGTDGTAYANHVVAEFRWTDTTVTPNVQRVKYDTWGGIITPRKTLYISFPETRPPLGGAAQWILERALKRGRDVSVTALSNYDAIPGKTVSIQLIDDAPIVKVIRAVSWRLSETDDDGTMTITTRDV